MSQEDELGKLIRAHEQKEQAVAEVARLTDSMSEYEFLYQEYLDIKMRVSQTRPLVSDMLLFLNSKGARPDMTNEMIKSINETVRSLDNVKDQAE